MNPPYITEDDRIKKMVRHLVELMQRFGNPPAKVIPWPSKKVAPGEARAILEANCRGSYGWQSKLANPYVISCRRSTDVLGYQRRESSAATPVEAKCLNCLRLEAGDSRLPDESS